jgi:UDP-N-acetyl-D-mannosaminuronic acid dehydrogenase
VIEKIKNAANEWKLNHSQVTTHKPLREPTVAIMGLAFKPDIDDLRESPALYIAQRLASELENVVCVEPNINNSQFTICSSQLLSIEDALDKADILVFLVAHKEFKTLSDNDCHQAAVLDFCLGVM